MSTVCETSARVRRLVFARAFGFCEGCGTSVIGRPYTIATRVVRDTGGATRADVTALWNLTLLCGSADRPGGCQLLREQQDEQLHERGLWLRWWEDARLAPVWLANPERPRIPVWLNGEGTYDFEAPSGDRARRRARRRPDRFQRPAHLSGHWLTA